MATQGAVGVGGAEDEAAHGAEEVGDKTMHGVVRTGDDGMQTVAGCPSSSCRRP
jgi:hypothetical protein